MPRQGAIAMAAALFAAAIVVVEFRMDEPWANGVHLVVAALPAAALLFAGLREPRVGERPTPAASALVLAGLALVAVADYRLWQVVSGGETFEGRRTLTAFFAVLALAAGGAAWRTRSAAALLVCALAVGGTVLAAVHWIFDTENVASYRPVLLALAVAFAAAAWALRASPRHRDVLVDAAGLSLFALLYASGTLLIVGVGEGIPDAWEAVVLVGALALIGYTVVTHAPGPGVLAILLLVLFATTVGYQAASYGFPEEDVSDPSLVGWPLVLLVLAGLVLAWGLRRARASEDPGDVTREVRR